MRRPARRWRRRAASPDAGRWSFASGCDNAHWGIVGGMLPRRGRRRSRPSSWCRARDYRIDDDWFTMGLAGTGSKTLVGEDVFVPDHRVRDLRRSVDRQRSPGTRGQHQSALSPADAGRGAALPGGAGARHGARRAAMLHGQVSGRTTRGAVAGGNNRMSDFATIQMRVAEATASIDAAQLMMHRDLKRDLRGRTDAAALRSTSHAHAQPADAFVCDQTADLRPSMRVFTAAGGNALGLHHPLQRFWRDIHAVSCAYQPELGRGRLDVRPARVRAGAARTVLSAISAPVCPRSPRRAGKSAPPPSRWQRCLSWSDETSKDEVSSASWCLPVSMSRNNSAITAAFAARDLAGFLLLLDPARRSDRRRAAGRPGRTSARPTESSVPSTPSTGAARGCSDAGSGRENACR